MDRTGSLVCVAYLIPISRCLVVIAWPFPATVFGAVVKSSTGYGVRHSEVLFPRAD